MRGRLKNKGIIKNTDKWYNFGGERRKLRYRVYAATKRQKETDDMRQLHKDIDKLKAQIAQYPSEEPLKAQL